MFGFNEKRQKRFSEETLEPIEKAPLVQHDAVFNTRPFADVPTDHLSLPELTQYIPSTAVQSALVSVSSMPGTTFSSLCLLIFWRKNPLCL